MSPLIQKFTDRVLNDQHQDQPGVTLPKADLIQAAHSTAALSTQLRQLHAPVHHDHLDRRIVITKIGAS